MEKVNWIVILKCDTDPEQVYPFVEEEDARTFYLKARMNWSEVYLCKVVEGPKV